MNINQEELIDRLQKITTENLYTAESTFSKLDANLLNTKPSEEKWSIAECLEHLNLYAEYYNVAIEKAIKNATEESNQKSFKSGWIGGYFANSMEARDRKIKKMSSPKDKNPALSEVRAEFLPRFISSQQKLLQLLESAKDVNLNENRIPITIAKWLKLKLGDTFRFVILHNQRHVLQALMVYKELNK